MSFKTVMLGKKNDCNFSLSDSVEKLQIQHKSLCRSGAVLLRCELNVSVGIADVIL